ncbi:hypothetical protein AZE42_07835 [Rhizopogon vesiculosus]|uniref:Uncharacterized protein n=1 Tax=Rhizopogon vesiculosus TaxID=180088 RepID=A0A1J8QLF0_9AGAM|nr:hypothetical protein AZE42_07835 [Rhizopogon vesiculosus]
MTLANLLRFRADNAGKRLDDTDMALGCMRVIFKKYDWTHLPRGHHLHGNPKTPVEVATGQRVTIQLD